MKLRVAFAFIIVVLLTGSVFAAPDGIWKDKTVDPTYNFQIQTFADGGMTVTVSAGIVSFYHFLDSDYSDGFSASQDLRGRANTLSINFTSDESAQASLAVDGEAARVFPISRVGRAFFGGDPPGSAPSGSLSSPTDRSTVSGIVSITGSASDDVAVQRVGVKIASDPEVNAVFDSGNNRFSYDWDTAAVRNGSIPIIVTVYDTEGLNTVAATISVNVSNPSRGSAPPTGSLTAPLNGAFVYGTYVISGTVTDNAGIERVGIEIGNSGEMDAVYDFCTDGFTYAWDTTSVQDDSYSIIVTAYDKEGQSAVIASITVTVVNDGPGDAKVTLVSPPDGYPQMGTRITFQWNALHGAEQYEIHLSSYPDASLMFHISYPTEAFETINIAIGPFPTYWRVRAKIGGQWTQWSDIWKLGE